MHTHSKVRVVSIVAAVIAVVVGLAGPAFAEGSFSGRMSSWYSGDKSKNWTDDNSDGTATRSVVAEGCLREFTGRIRKVRNNAPDTTVASEHINCQSYDDAVNAGDVARGTYHFSITSLPTECHSGTCTQYPTSGTYKVHW